MSDLDAYDYELPRELIAQQPLRNRNDARLMLVDRARDIIDHYHVRDLPELLQSGDVLVMNDSKVVPARLVGYRTDTLGKWQGLFLREDNTSGCWEVLSKTRGRLSPGDRISVTDRHARESMTLQVIGRVGEGNLIVKPEMEGTAEDVLERFGRIPIPPYVRDGQMVDSDVKDYQTVYAKAPGSVAAPTAGLHFTKELFVALQKAGISGHAVTLHVGLGTFRPIGGETLDEHKMHSEWGQIGQATAAALNTAKQEGRRCVAIGTTSVRVLESAATSDGQLQPWTGMTDLFIKPGYRFRAVDALMTNFHLPKSTLLVLVSTFANPDLIRRAYAEAVQQRYRFYSYGDAMLIL